MPGFNRLYEFEAIGTHWWLEVLTDKTLNKQLINNIQKYTKEFTNNYSRFIGDSLLNQMCREGELINPPSELVEMMKFARQMHKVSNGLFNITVGGELHKIGYGSQDYANSISPDFWQKTTISGKKINIPADVTLDFGGFGKGWLIEVYKKILINNGFDNFIINGGGDLYTQNSTAVEFYLEDPRNSNRALGSVRIKKGALAASSSQKRRWKYNQKSYHHIIDPRSSRPSRTKVLTSFVQSQSALVADSLATILFIEPSLEESLKKHYDFSSIIIYS